MEYRRPMTKGDSMELPLVAPTYLWQKLQRPLQREAKRPHPGCQWSHQYPCPPQNNYCMVLHPIATTFCLRQWMLLLLTVKYSGIVFQSLYRLSWCFTFILSMDWMYPKWMMNLHTAKYCYCRLLILAASLLWVPKTSATLLLMSKRHADVLSTVCMGDFYQERVTYCTSGMPIQRDIQMGTA